MRTIERGCTFDDTSKEWAVWMTTPKGFSISDHPLWNRRLLGDKSCQLKNVVNRKGIPMLVLRGKLPPNIRERDLKGFLIQMRADFTTYINKKKKEAGL